MEKIGDAKSSQEVVEDGELDAFEMSNISLRLNSYEDIFSSFDPRPYIERAISVDFIEEAKRASIDKSEKEIELRLLLPEKVRRIDKERTIRKRLKEHFSRHAKKVRKEHGKVIRTGMIFILAGILTMFLASFFLFNYSEKSMYIHFLLIIFEPAGWFFFWEGLYQIIFESKQTKPDLEFYEKMSKSEVMFVSY